MSSKNEYKKIRMTEIKRKLNYKSVKNKELKQSYRKKIDIFISEE